MTPSGTPPADALKVMDLSAAVGRFVRDGCHLSIGGFTINRNPMAAVYEIIRRKRRGLHLYAHSNGHGMDELVGAGCVSTLEIAYGGSGKFAATSVRFRKAVQEGTIRVEDYTNFQMALRFLAGAMGVPFLPCRSGLGTDLLEKWGFPGEMRRRDARLPDRKMVVLENPFGDWGGADRVVLVPAINPDVTLIHVQRADTQGTCRIRGLTFADVEQAKAARHLIVTCEELVDPEEMRRHPGRNQIPFPHVDAVVHVPHGAYPTACHRHYDYDPEFLKAYAHAARDDRRHAEHLQRFVHGPADHRALLAAVGPDRLRRLAADPETGYAADLDRR